MKNCCRVKLGTCRSIVNPQPASHFAKDRKRKDGRTVHCKMCLKAMREVSKEYNSAYSKKWRKQNPEKCRLYDEIKSRKHGAKIRRKRYVLKCRYGLTTEEWQTMHLKQNHCCAICLNHMDDTQDKTLHVDHCHKTKKVRGLLCSVCNKGIGLFKDNYEYLEKAIAYLKSHEENQECPTTEAKTEKEDPIYNPNKTSIWDGISSLKN